MDQRQLGYTESLNTQEGKVKITWHNILYGIHNPGWSSQKQATVALSSCEADSSLRKGIDELSNTKCKTMGPQETPDSQ
ncbi:hypothetical protein Tco_0196249 [Tanacetum coccineum]